MSIFSYRWCRKPGLVVAYRGTHSSGATACRCADARLLRCGHEPHSRYCGGCAHRGCWLLAGRGSGLCSWGKSLRRIPGALGRRSIGTGLTIRYSCPVGDSRVWALPFKECVLSAIPLLYFRGKRSLGVLQSNRRVEILVRDSEAS